MSALLRAVAALIMRMVGWRPIGERPTVPKYVLIAAPHTSNWDLPMMLLFASYFGLRPHWMGKKELFRFPFGWFMRLLGGLPVDRSAANDLVAQTAARLRGAERLVIAVPPEGTRSYRDHWKSGFYHIARAAQVPIVCSTLDWGKREGGFIATFMPSDDIHVDMDRMRQIYAGRLGKFPANTSAIRLKDEAPPAP